MHLDATRPRSTPITSDHIMYTRLSSQVDGSSRHHHDHARASLAGGVPCPVWPLSRARRWRRSHPLQSAVHSAHWCTRVSCWRVISVIALHGQQTCMVNLGPSWVHRGTHFKSAPPPKLHPPARSHAALAAAPTAAPTAALARRRNQATSVRPAYAAYRALWAGGVARWPVTPVSHSLVPRGVPAQVGHLSIKLQRRLAAHTSTAHRRTHRHP